MKNATAFLRSKKRQKHIDHFYTTPLYYDLVEQINKQGVQ